jgi:hypothetical protein
LDGFLSRASTEERAVLKRFLVDPRLVTVPRTELEGSMEPISEAKCPGLEDEKYEGEDIDLD